MEHVIGNKYLVKPVYEDRDIQPSVVTLNEVKVNDITDKAIEIAYKDNYSNNSKKEYSHTTWYAKGDFDKNNEVVEVLLDMSRVDKESN